MSSSSPDERVKPGYNDRRGFGDGPRLALPKVLADPPRAKPSDALRTELAVVCVEMHGKFPPRYVHILRAMVARRLDVPFRFYVITDRPKMYEYIGSGIRTIEPQRPKLEAWFCKINLFAPDQFTDGTRVLYFDLDVVVTGSLIDFATCRDPFVMIREFNPYAHQVAHNSSVMAWDAGGEAEEIFHTFGDDWCKRTWGDQEAIWAIMGNERVHDWPDSWVKSYKYHCQSGPPPGCRVVVCHGDPKPDAIRDPWLVSAWK